MSRETAGGRIALARPCFDESEEREVAATLRSGWVAQGPRVLAFEKQFAARVGAREAVAVSSGTTALFLTLHTLGVGPGDEVIVPSLSFVASANAVVHCGAVPVFIDVDPDTYNMDPDRISAAVGERTRAVMPVHQLGLPAQLDRIGRIARDHDLLVVEDAACALGSELRGRPIGSSGTPACFSFHARKVISTGEGGMITTDDRELAARLRRLRHQGMSISDLERHRAKRLIVEEYGEVGFNFRLSDLQAAVGLVQLRKLEGFLERRRELAHRYHAELAAIDGIELPFVPDGALPNYQSYVVRLSGCERPQRDRVIDLLYQQGIATRPGVMASHREPCHGAARVSGDLEHTEKAADQTLVLPIYPDLGDEDQSRVIAGLAAAARAVLG